MGYASIGGVKLLIDPDSVEWDFDIKLSEQSTLGGRVIQVYGTSLGDMTVTGTFGRGNLKKGDEAGWEEAARFATQVKNWVRRDANTYTPSPLRFLYTSKKWDFKVHVKSMTPIEHSNTNIAPTYSLVLFIVEDSTGRVVKGITDRYIERLMDGIGWKQTEYNGPTAEEIEKTLAPYQGSVREYLKQDFLKAVGSAAQGGSTGAAGGDDSGAGPVPGPDGLNAYLYALRKQESNNDYQARSGISDASGAYQYISTTWANYKGYPTAASAPPRVQDERAAKDATAQYKRYGSWGAAATVHFTGHYVNPNSAEYDRSPGPGNPTVRSYVNTMLDGMKEYTP